MAEQPPFGLRTHVEARWSARRAADVRAAIERRVRSRRAARGTIAKSCLTLAAGVTLALLVRQRLVPGPPPLMTAPSLPRPALAEPVATPLTADTELVVDPEGSGRAFVLRRGRARFVVTHDERHPFRVRVGSLVVEDVGTIFFVGRLSQNRFEVVVEEGQVAVQCEDSRIDLGSGQQRIFECGQPESEAIATPRATPTPRIKGAPTGPAVKEQTPPKVKVATAQTSPGGAEADLSPPAVAWQVEPSRAGDGAASSNQTRPSPAAPSGESAGTSVSGAPMAPQRPAAVAWQVLAERGQYREAYDSLRNESRVSVRDETHELLLAADTARLSGHSTEAVPYLRRILLQHGEDPRAHLAAFTLGRVLLDELARPAEAADAFERARAGRGPLAEDALAREVEACARAGDAGRARALALDYRRSYPQGRRTRAVAKFGGLEQ